MKKISILLETIIYSLFCFLVFKAMSPNAVRAQGKAAQDWPTANATPQRTAWIRTDFEISRENMQTRKDFGVVRKYQLEGGATQVPLPAFHLLSSVGGSFGFKSIGYLVDASGMARGIDSDTPLTFWKTRVAPAPSGSCAGVVSAGVASVTSLAPNLSAAAVSAPVAALSARPEGMSEDFPTRGRSGSAVGNPGEGAPSLRFYTGVSGLSRDNPSAGPAADGAGRGGPEIPPDATKVSPDWLPIPFPDVWTKTADSSTPLGGGGRGGLGVLVLTAEGNVRSLSKTLGFDTYIGPTAFLPPNSQAFGLVAIDLPDSSPADIAAGPGRGGTRLPTLYAATSNACGGVAGVWGLDLGSATKRPVSWKTQGGPVAGTAGPAIGTDGTVYAATGDGEYSPAAWSDSLVALESKTLRLKDFFTPGKSEFVSSPVVITRNNRDLIAVANRDGRIYLLDSAAVGGADHKTPLSVSAKFANFGAETPGALASWQDSDGAWWVVSSVSGTLASTSGFQSNGAITSGAIVAFKIVDQNGRPTLQPGWISRDIRSPLPPIVVNGVVLTAGTGAGQNAVLYALDGATGREFLNSGTAVTGGPPKGALSAQFGTIYLQTANNILWALGFSQEFLKEDHGALFNK